MLVDKISKSPNFPRKNLYPPTFTVLPEKTQEMIKTLSKPSKKRTSDELNSLINLVSEIAFFKERDIKAKDYTYIVQSLQYELFRKNETIFNYGDIGDKFYLILSGHISVRIPSPNYKKFTKEIFQL